jgi:hypothetical protein
MMVFMVLHPFVLAMSQDSVAGRAAARTWSLPGVDSVRLATVGPRGLDHLASGATSGPAAVAPDRDLHAALLLAGDRRQAAREADAAVRLDPCREGAYRQLMRAYVAAGDRGLALRAFDRCRRALRDELGVDPSPDTLALYGQLIRAG